MAIIFDAVLRRLRPRQVYRPTRTAVLTALLACAIPSSVLAADAGSAAADPPCVGLVLGGGGARGAAHVGVLKVLERERIPICKVAGTSMGSIVGGLYAAGYSPDEMERIVEHIDWASMFTDDPPRRDLPMERKDEDFRHLLSLDIGYVDGRVSLPGGLVRGQKLLLLLRRLTLSTWNVRNFDELPIPFRAVAGDIVTGKQVVFHDGDLALAIRSSMSVPGAFAPVHVDGHLLVDGGMVDNVPVDVMRDMGAKRMIVVDVSSPLVDEKSLSSPASVLNQMITALMAERTQRNLDTLGAEDVLIRPELGTLSSAAFDRSVEAIAIGERAAEAALPQLRRFSVDEATFAAYRSRQRHRDFDPGVIAFLDVAQPVPASAASNIERATAGDIDKPFDVDRLENDIGMAYGDGRYQQIDYRIVERDGESGIEILPTLKPWSAIGKFGFQLDDNFNGNNNYLLSAELTFNNINSAGAKWRNVLQLGRIGGLYSELYQPLGETGATYLKPSFELRNEKIPLWVGGNRLADYQVKRRMLGLEVGYTPDPKWRVSAGLIHGRDRAELLTGNPQDYSGGTENFTGMTYKATWDTLDSVSFPTNGLFANLAVTSYHHWMGSDVDGDVARAEIDWAQAWGRYRVLLGTRLSSALDDGQSLQAQTFLGGFLNLSGFEERALNGNQSALARGIVYRRTGNTSRLFSMPMYVGASLETGGTWASKSLVDSDDLVVAGSLFTGFSTPLGPMFLAYGRNSSGVDSWYLVFGSLLHQDDR